MNDLGRSDYEVGDALMHMLTSLAFMIDATSVSPARMDEVNGAYNMDIAMSLCLNPQKIDDEYQRIRKAAFAVGENAEVFVKIREAREHLKGWLGKSADAFRAQLDRIEIFASQTQHTAVMFALQYLGALYGMAYHMRQSYYDLAVAVKAAADHEVDESAARVAELNLAIAVNFVEAALDAKPGAAVAFVVKGAGELTKSAIEGDGADFVIDSYLQRSNGLHKNFENNLEQLNKTIWDEWNHQVQVNDELKILEPIPVECDIDGPRFNYAEFYTEEYPRQGPFAQRVEEERTKHAQEEANPESRINKRLEGR